MKTAFRQVALATTPEAEAAVGELLHAVFGIAPSVFTHPEQRVPVLSVYLDEKKSITEAQRQAVAEGMARIEIGGETPPPRGLGGFLEATFSAHPNWR
jgi:hypothetical protein